MLGSICADTAGSDTVGSAMSFLFYELAKHQEQAEKVFAELQSIDIFDCAALLSLPHLSAVINETLRFHHVIPTGGYRDTPKEGLVISGRFIPEGTTVIAPRYILNRRELIQRFLGSLIVLEEKKRSPLLICYLFVNCSRLRICEAYGVDSRTMDRSA